MPDTSVPPCMSMFPFKLLPLCWSSEGMSQSKSVYRPFKRNSWDSRRPLSNSATTPTGFYSQKLWGLLFLALKPWAGDQVWSWDPSLLRGEFCSWDIPPDFYLSHVSVGLACYMSPPLLSVLMWLLLYFPGCRTYIYISGGSEWWLFCSLVVKRLFFLNIRLLRFDSAQAQTWRWSRINWRRNLCCLREIMSWGQRD